MEHTLLMLKPTRDDGWMGSNALREGTDGGLGELRG
jgi:hypothetical protein